METKTEKKNKNKKQQRQLNQNGVLIGTGLNADVVRGGKLENDSGRILILFLYVAKGPSAKPGARGILQYAKWKRPFPW